MRPPYPAARRAAVVDTFHGVAVPDPYRWLEAPDSPETRAWIDAQRRLTEAHLSAIPARAALRARLTALWQHARYGLPVERGGRTFYTHNDGTWEQDQLLVEDTPGAPPRVLLDPATFSEDGTVSLAQWSPSPDGRWLAYALSDGGADWITWHILRVDSGEVLPEVLRWVKFSGVTWTPDSTALYYSRYPEPADPLEQVLEHQRLYRHTLGTPQHEDVLLYARPDEPAWGFGPWLSHHGDVLLVVTWRSTDEVNQLHRLDPADPAAPPVPLLEDWSAGRIPVTVADGWLYLKTSADAPRGRLIRLRLDDPSVVEEIIPEQDASLRAVSRIGDQLVAQYLRDARSEVRLHALDGTPRGTLPLPGVGSVSGFLSDEDATHTHYVYTDFTTPAASWRHDLQTGAKQLIRRPAVDFDPDAYVSEQVFYTSHDGTQVPMFIARHRDTRPDGRRPTLLYGYGGFNIPLVPAFSVAALVWMERGGVYAVANLRGGGEYGEDWHAAGTRLQKQNVFDDFIAAAEWLTGPGGWTCPARLASHGRSNGGLLVGATMLQRPDLFGAAIPGVGVLDMLRYHRFTIGRAWAGDYGTAEESPEMFAALLAYSPVHCVREGAAYPATLVTTGDHDDRVVPAHSYKFTAALQHGQGGPAPVLVRIDARAGHGSGRSVSQVIAEQADQWAFLLQALGVTDADAPQRG